METHIASGGTIESFIAQLGPWNCRGRKPFLTITELEETAEEISQQPGQMVDQKEMAQIITNKRKEKLAEEGMTVLRGDAPSNKTVKNCVGTMALFSGMSSSIGRSNPKTPTQFTAEHSI